MSISSGLFAFEPFAKISGKLAFAREGETVLLYINRYGVSTFTGTEKEFKSKVHNHHFEFKIPVGNTPVYFFLKSFAWNINQRTTGLDFVERGDQIVIDDLNKIGYVHFSGKGAEKLNLIYQLQEFDRFDSRQNPIPLEVSEIVSFFRYRDTLTDRKMEYLNLQKRFLSPNAYLILKARILAGILGKYSTVGGEGGLAGKAIDSAVLNLKSYHDDLIKKYRLPDFSKTEMLGYSHNYATAIIGKYNFDSCVVVKQPFSLYKCYTDLKKAYNGGLRELLVMTLINRYKKYSDEISLTLNDATSSWIHNQDFNVMLNNIKNNTSVGKPFFNFSLPDSLGRLHRLSDFKGKLVVLDYWFTGCGNCKRLLPFMIKIEEQFKDRPIVFISISIDRNRELWLKSLASKEYSSANSLNLYTADQGSQHPLIKTTNINEYPTILILDQNGKIRQRPKDPRTDDGRDMINELNKGIAAF